MSSLSEQLKSSTYVLALLGAGLSASSGIPTFANRPEYWRGRSYSSLTTKAAFEQDPALIWMFHEYMRTQALAAKPNPGHLALVQLAKTNPNFFAITQNIDDLSERAGHPEAQLAAIHGSLSTVACCESTCTYTARYQGFQPFSTIVNEMKHDLIDSTKSLPYISVAELPWCPHCRSGMLRPGVVWYGELLVPEALRRLDQWLDSVPYVDLLLLIGTSAQVSSGFIEEARQKGASVAHFNLIRNELVMQVGDWYVPGDAAETLPQLFAGTFGSP